MDILYALPEDYFYVFVFVFFLDCLSHILAHILPEIWHSFTNSRDLLLIYQH